MDNLPVDRSTAQRLLLGSDEITVWATCADTQGAMFVVETRMPPGGGPPIMHRHDPSEVYHVIEGEFTFYLGDPSGAVEVVTARAGDVVPLAGGTPHTVRNESSSDAVAFVVHSPGETMEGFITAAAALARDGVPELSTVLALADRHGITMLGPVPAAVTA